MRTTIPSAPRAARLLLALTALGCLAYLVVAINLEPHEQVPSWMLPALSFASSVCLILRGVARKRDRAAWLLLGAGGLAWSAGFLLYGLWVSKLAHPPSPSICDALWLSYYPFTVVALALLVRRRVGHIPRVYWLDVGLGVAATAAVGSVLTAGLVNANAGQNTIQSIVAAGYPIGDLLTMLLVVGAVMLGGWGLSRRWIALFAAQLVYVLTDTVYLNGITDGTWTFDSAASLGWPVGVLLVAFAAWCRDDETAAQPRASRWRGLLTPAACAVMAIGVLMWDHFERLPSISIVLAGVALVFLTIRLAVLFRENISLVEVTHREATTDSLTSLGNRRALFAELERNEDPGAGPSVLALFDLDGFKGYNDAFGHPAGDALLRRLGKRLKDVTTELGGQAYRLGGDEFCVVIRRQGRTSRGLALLTSAALEERGHGFVIEASWGAVDLPCADGPAEALGIADRRMYEHKTNARPSTAQQTADVLLAAERERDPDLGDHAHGVAEIAGEVAERLDLQVHQVHRVRLAAELHDIGKIAIPDRILTKPGPLDDEEWAFIRRHTEIGERIMLAALDLVEVAPIVRSSHERWDGEGYPDALARDAIPLGARIVSVCDAFDAMISARPYSRSLTTEAALAELKRCAGRQFDPAVVAAFDAVLEDRRRLLSRDSQAV